MKKLLATCLVYSISLPAFANDSAGTTGAGGIVFEKTQGIVMQDEALTITPTLVTVTYQFKNTTQDPITKNILFPLPPYKTQGGNDSWDLETNPELSTRVAPFLNFSVIIDGIKTPYQTIQRAMVSNKDVTQQLKNAHIPLNPALVAGDAPAFDSDLRNVKSWKQAAENLKLLGTDGKPLWNKETIYSFQATFPPNKITTISHSYRPATGIYFGYRPGNNEKTDEDILHTDLTQTTQLFGLDIAKSIQQQSFVAYLAERIKKASSPSATNCLSYHQNQDGCLYTYFYNVDYILKTGANWDGPIQHFKLTIQYPESGVVTYNDFQGTDKAEILNRPGVLTISMNNFTPKNDLDILFAAPVLYRSQLN